MSTRVLIVDTGDGAAALAERFVGNGCRVRLCAGVGQAAEEMKKDGFDLVLADAGMGVELSARMPRGPRLILTAEGGTGAPSLHVLHKEMEAKDYLEACGAGKRVVFMDEKVDPTSHLARHLESAGHKVIHGPCEGTSWETARGGSLDVAFLDAGMGGWKAWRGLTPSCARAVMVAGPCGGHVEARLARGEAPVVAKKLGAADLEELVKACLKNAPRASMSVLLVDDDDPLRESIADFLRGEGFQVEEASRAREGIRKAVEGNFEVIVSDYHMPDLSGLELIEQVRVVRPDVKIILLTGAADLDSALHAVDMRIHAYLSKPVNPDTLLSVLDKALRERRLEAQIKDLIQELQGANQKLESFDRVKSSFLFLVAHDIRSPLSGAKGFVEFVIARNPDLPQKIREELGMVGQALEQVNRLVSDLMDLGRMETGKLRVTPEAMNVRAFAGDLRRRFEVLARQEKVGLEWRDEDAPEAFFADAFRLDQVVSNLVGNAIKHAGRDKTVTVRFAPEADGGLAIDVSDNGRGLKPEDVSRVFEPYFQGDDGMALKKGIGLGLAIVQQLVEAHGGRVWAESAGEGKGCTFRVRLPRAGGGQPGAKSQEATS